MPTYTKAQVRQHKTETDCWIIVHGKVYDVTKFLDDHPGGPDIIVDSAGSDTTEQFEDTGHSQDARKDMAKYLIGDLELAPGEEEAKPSKPVAHNTPKSHADSSATTSMNPFLIAAIVVAIAVGAFILFNP